MCIVKTPTIYQKNGLKKKKKKKKEEKLSWLRCC